MTEQELSAIQQRADDDGNGIGLNEESSLLVAEDRKRLLLEVYRLRGELVQFRSSVKQYAEYHAYLMRSEV